VENREATAMVARERVTNDRRVAATAVTSSSMLIELMSPERLSLDVSVLERGLPVVTGWNAVDPGSRERKMNVFRFMV